LLQLICLSFHISCTAVKDQGGLVDLRVETTVSEKQLVKQDTMAKSNTDLDYILFTNNLIYPLCVCVCVVLGIGPRALCFLGKHSVT
jgi:hypothetical protein